MLDLVFNPTNVGHCLFVDAVNGDDASARPYSQQFPYKTLTAAKTAAVAGDTIVVRPGTYDERNLLKNLVNWHFINGAIVDYTGSGRGAIFDDSSFGANAAIVSVISGDGTFMNRSTDPTQESVLSVSPVAAVYITNASSSVNISGKEFIVHKTMWPGGSYRAAITHLNGTLVARASYQMWGTGTASGAAGVWWEKGFLAVGAPLIHGSFGVYTNTSGSAVDFFGVTANQILGDFAAGNGTGMQLSGTNLNAAVWIDAQEIIGNGTGIQYSASDKLYLRVMKLMGIAPFNTSGAFGQMWATIQKITVNNYAFALPASIVAQPSAKPWTIDIGEIEDLGVRATIDSLLTIGGKVDVKVRTCKMASTTLVGVRIQGNDPSQPVYFEGNVDSTDSASGNPVVIDGTGIFLRNCFLRSDPARNCITATTPNDLTIVGTLNADVGPHANVTLASPAYVFP